MWSLHYFENIIIWKSVNFTTKLNHTHYIHNLIYIQIDFSSTQGLFYTCTSFMWTSKNLTKITEAYLKQYTPSIHMNLKIAIYKIALN